eukprot:574821-Pleurochrysis_carterae.AAC.1
MAASSSGSAMSSVAEGTNLKLEVAGSASMFAGLAAAALESNAERPRSSSASSPAAAASAAAPASSTPSIQGRLGTVSIDAALLQILWIITSIAIAIGAPGLPGSPAPKGSPALTFESLVLSNLVLSFLR